ncbi:uncharacterized protein LOC136026091 isoform X2 [Artemia franciscana]|uniref:uncharacterized protein LOC136026091 isoform X2 n=1 Tax=Artemia franciscana TaxID=6661 RepID=UPI0032DB47DB
MEVTRCTHSNELIFNQFCLDCFTITLENSKSLIIQRIQAVKELLLTLVSEPSGLKDALAQNKDVTYHLGILLLNNLSINDKALVNLCCEAIGLVCNLTQHEVVAQSLVRKISCLVFESSDLTKVGHCVHLLGKMLNSFHGLSWFIVSHGEGYLEAISSGVLSSNQSLSSDVLYTFLQVFTNEPRSLYTLSEKLIQNVLGGICVVLSTGSGIDPTRNALALLRLFTSSQTHRHFLFFFMENPSGMSVFDALKACIIHKETDFQIGSLQLVSLTLESELECQAQNRGMELLERFLDESFAEHIFESLISSNFLLLTSALRCLEIFEESKLYFNYKHVVYAVPSLIRLCQSLVERSQSSEILSLAIQRLVSIFFGNNTALSQPNPVESYQSAILRLVETVIKSPHIDIHRNSIHLLLLVLDKENVPKPLPVVQIKYLVKSAVEVGLLEVVSTLRSDVDTSPAVRENHLEKIRLSFDLMVCITRLFLESEKNPSFLLSTFASNTESSEEQTELVEMREIIVEFLKLLPRLESLSFEECPSNLLLSIFELFGLCFEEDILASALIYSIGDTLLTSAVHCRNLAATRRSEELLEVLNMFIALVIQKFSSCDSIDWLELIKCLPSESSKWFNLLSDRQVGIQIKKVVAVLIYLCDRAEKDNGNTKFDIIDEMKIKNLDGFLSDLLYDGSQIEPTILKAVWYLVACESSLLLDMDSLLSRLDNCPFEDMISGLQIFLLALKTNFNVSFVQFKVDDETLFFEVLLWKLENLAIKYSSIADDLIWVCIVEFLKLAHKKEFLEDMLSRETSLLHILKLKFDVNSLLDLPYECLLFINVLVYLTYRANDPPLNDEMKEVFEFIRNKASLTVKNMPCDFYQGSKSLFSEKDGSDLKFPIFREVANAFGIPL